MALETPPRSLEPGALGGRDPGGRLGIDSRAGAWPATPRLKSYEAAGFRFLQVRIPPAPTASAGVHGRLADEVRSLRALAARAGRLGVRIAVENLAPAYAGTERVSHDPLAVARLVRAIGSDHLRICLDLGHTYIAAGLAGCGILELVEPVLDEVILFEAHDNFGARADAQRAGGIEPLRLDLHLAPGAGSVPWAELAPLLARHDAPIQLEIHPAGRPEPARLATVMCELLGLGSAVGYPSADP